MAVWWCRIWHVTIPITSPSVIIIMAYCMQQSVVTNKALLHVIQVLHVWQGGNVPEECLMAPNFCSIKYS